MKRTIKLLALGSLLALAFPFVGCEKEMDEGDGMIEIFAETMGSNSKVRLDGANSTWENGDPICINGENVSVVRGDNNRAYISYANPQSVNRAVYPASLAANSNLSSDSISLNFPAYYHYRTDASGHQLLDVPMAARSTDRESLRFKHLTGALYVTVRNTASVPLTLQSVTVASNWYQLNGSRTIDLSELSNESGTISPIRTSNNDNRNYVTLVFDTGYTLATNASLRVMLPVLPVGGNDSYKNDFTIRVKTCSTNKQNFYLHSQSQTSGTDHTLARNELGYATTEITVTNETPTPTIDQEGRHYVVRTPLDFKLMTENITSGDITGNAYIDILADLDMTDIPVKTINNASNHFWGTIDGHNHRISNLTIKSRLLNSIYYCALFSSSDNNIQIKNIRFDGLVLNHQGVGSNDDSYVHLAGLICEIQGNTLNLNSDTINYSAINVTNAIGAIYFGGLVCEPQVINITNCSVTMPNISISGKSFYWGGFIASVNSTNTTITSSSWSGSVNLTATNTARVGGFIGQKLASNLTITNCSVNGGFAITNSKQYNYLASLIGQYTPNSQNTVTIDNNNINVTITLNGQSISPVPQYNNNN